VGFKFVFSLSVVERGIIGPKQLSRRKLEKGKRKRKRGRWMDGKIPLICKWHNFTF